MPFAEATKVSRVNRVPPHLCRTGLSLHRNSLYSPCNSVHKDIGVDNDLITFAGGKPFGLVNIVRRRPERNTAVDIERKSGVLLSPASVHGYKNQDYCEDFGWTTGRQ
jgi:hypothetical protein